MPVYCNVDQSPTAVDKFWLSHLIGWRNWWKQFKKTNGVVQELKKLKNKALGPNTVQNGCEGAAALAVYSPGPWLLMYLYYINYNILEYKLYSNIVITFQIAFWCINKLNIGFGINSKSKNNKSLVWTSYFI